jgi:NosR/NirI family transcriptional regulator, nitrous oxide reductase regulator
VTLGATVLVLGFSGGFLSVSHIAGLIKVGPSVFLSDLPLLLLASFTLVTTVFWGRVFCGYLCPFGALQDVLERVVPKRFRVRVPDAIHRGALKAKYGVLGIVLLPALLGSPLILFQYFEPFGTVFFLTPSLLLWAIALAFLGAAAVIPRFYCRYACPLGAALAVGSVLAPFRIRRVPQCSVCTVCEQRCPTGIISREAVQFSECVRCGDCDAQLERKAGVCRHDMDRIRPRLVQLQMGGRGTRIGAEAAGAEGGA